MISAIGGTGGVGKTALAVRWAHQVADRFPDGQLYVNLRGFDPAGLPLAPAEAVRGFLAGFGVPAERVPPSAEAQAGLYRSLTADKKLLIVLDNAADSAQVRALLPGSARCLVLVTSRSELAGLVAAEGARPVALGVLSDDEAVQLLAARLGPERLAGEPQAMVSLTRLCGGLALALAIVAGRAATRPDVALAALAADLAAEPDRLDAFETGEDATSVRAVFSWSCRQLPRPAARMFRLLAVHPGPDISIAAAASLAGVPVPAARRLLSHLAGVSLAREHVTGRYVLHDLLRAYAGEQAGQAETREECEAATYRALDHYLHTAYQAAVLCETRLPGLAMPPPRAGVTPEPLAARAVAMAWYRDERQVLVAVSASSVTDGFGAYAGQLTYWVGSGYWVGAFWNGDCDSGKKASGGAEDGCENVPVGEY